MPLRTGNIVRLDFRVRGSKHETAILTLSSGSEQAAHNRAVDIYTKWGDLHELSDWTESGNQCVTVFDDDQKRLFDAGFEPSGAQEHSGSAFQSGNVWTACWKRLRAMIIRTLWVYSTRQPVPWIMSPKALSSTTCPIRRLT